MARSVILGNSRLTVGLNKLGYVHDFYYPYVGLENLTTARSVRHKIGVWVDGIFSWTDDDPAWQHSVEFSSEALTSAATIKNEKLGVTLYTQDFVDYEHDAFCRVISIENNHDDVREIRLFMHQVFEISRAGRGDTALYEPDGNYILDYKGRCCLLISGRDDQDNPFDQYSVGNYGIEGKQGTFMDAEDGELSGNPVEHGGVDSVIRFKLEVEAGQARKVEYWVAAADSQYNCSLIHDELRQGLGKRVNANRMYWEQWLGVASARLSAAPEKQQELARKSLMVIKAHSDSRGGIIASCDSSIYNYGRDYYSYVWPRDGAYAMWPLIRLGYKEEPEAFFNFCADVVTEQGYLMHKYQPDRAIGSTWHPLVHNMKRELAIQEDETATVLIMLGEYYEYSKNEEFIINMYNRFIIKAANFMSGFIDDATGLPHATYDLWEEKFLTTSYTTATVYRALVVASEFAEKFGESQRKDSWLASANNLLERRQVFTNPDTGTTRKGFLLQDDGSLAFDNTVDLSSMYGAMTFGYFKDDELTDFRESAEAVITTLTPENQASGLPRYQGDNYFRASAHFTGNPWIITTLWAAQFYIRTGNYDKATSLMQWVEDQALPTGVLPEQVHPETGQPLSVTPLVWSHAEYLNTVLDLAARSKESSKIKNQSSEKSQIAK